MQAGIAVIITEIFSRFTNFSCINTFYCTNVYERLRKLTIEVV
jgi:hypothetical protein